MPGCTWEGNSEAWSNVEASLTKTPNLQSEPSGPSSHLLVYVRGWVNVRLCRVHWAPWRWRTPGVEGEIICLMCCVITLSSELQMQIFVVFNVKVTQFSHDCVTVDYDMSLTIGSSHNSFTAHQVTWWNCSTALYQPYRGKNKIHPIHGTEQRKTLSWQSAAVQFSPSHYCVKSINMRHSSS